MYVCVCGCMCVCVGRSAHLLDLVASQRQDLELAHAGQRDDPVDAVGGQRQALAVAQAAQGAVHLHDGRDLAVQLDVVGVLGRHVVGRLPVLDRLRTSSLQHTQHTSSHDIIT